MPSHFPWRIAEMIAPSLLIDGYRLFRGYTAYPRFKATLEANRKWHNAFLGERVYVLANGPSLASFDRSEFRGRRAIVMNSFDRAEWKDEVDIVAHCLGEPRGSCAWHDPRETISGTRSASYWMHYSSCGAFPEMAKSKQIHYVLPACEPRVWGRRSIALHNVSLGYQTTAQLAIMVALYMGFTDIVLLGFDHDWLASPKVSRHFYSSQRDSSDMIGTYSYYNILKFSLRMWEIYYALDAAATAHGAQIRNMTENSFLDVFPSAAPGT